MSRYIDADKAKEKLGVVRSGYSCFLEEDRPYYDVLSETIKMINEMPTANVRENVRGEWIDCGIHGDWAWEQDGHGNSWHIWKCSKCEYKTEHHSNYCPNCGAQMER